MKKIRSAVLILVMLLMMTQTAFAQTPVQVIVGGEEIVTNVRPVIVNDRVILPVRAVFEALDAKVKYIDAEKKVVAKRYDITVEFVIGSNVMTVNGEEKTIDVAPMIKNNRTLVPLRACAEAFGLGVVWDETRGIAKVFKPVQVVKYSETSPHIEEYDQWNNLIFKQEPSNLYVSSEVAREEMRYDRRWYEYDQYGNVTKLTSKIRGGSTTVKTYNHVYDHKGRIVSTEEVYAIEYSDGRWSSSVDRTVAYTYNDYNQVTSTIYENVTFYNDYDENGLLLSKWRKDSNGVTYQYKYKYDENGNMIEKYDVEVNLISRYYYDENGYLVKMCYHSVNPDTGEVKENPGTTETHKYDENGNEIEWVIAYTGGRRTVHTKEYNEYNLLVKSSTASNFFLTLTGNTEGRTNDASSRTYEYDANGNLIAEVWTDNTFGTGTTEYMTILR